MVRLESKKLNPIYTTGMRCSGSERLLASEGAYWHFYSPESVEGMLAAL